MSNDIVANRSALKDFLASIATISGDLSNITAPPFVLSEKSTVEIPQYWADHQALFVSQAKEEDAEKRALSVLKYFLCTLRNQQFAGRPEEDGVKKPLNAFLGELFLGGWNDEEFGETRLVSEQVSHHPPVTACYLWNDKYGVRAEGFTQQEVTFSGNVSIKQKGYAILHIDKYEEDHLIPVPDVKVKGILSGVPYPELTTECSIISSSGYVSHINFSGKSFLGSGQKHEFEAKLYHVQSPENVLYTAEGVWNGQFSIKDARSGEDVEHIDVNTIESTIITVADVSEQDPWESRRAWQDVVAAQHKGDMKGVADAKSIVEQGQRQMRKDEAARNAHWTNTFFRRVQHDPVFEKLSRHDPSSFTVDPEGGIWKVDREAVRAHKVPYHEDLTPANLKVNGAPEVKPANGDMVEPPSRGDAERSEHADMSQRQGDSGTDVDSTRTETGPRGQEESRLSSGEPTDEQVAAFLRAKHSNVVY